MLIAVILAIAGIVVLAVVVLGAIFSMLGMGYLSGGLTTLSPNFHSFQNGVVPTNIVGLIVGLLLGLAAVWVIYIVSAFFLRRSFSSIGRGLNVGLFGTAGLLYLIGAALTIILVGLLVIFVAEILLVVAFFSIPDQPPQPSATPVVYTPPPPPTVATINISVLKTCRRNRHSFRSLWISSDAIVRRSIRGLLQPRFPSLLW